MSVLQYVVNNPSSVKIAPRFVVCSPSNMGVADGRPVFSAIAIPVEKKQDFQCPGPMIDALIDLLPRITMVIAIGWRATENHFLALLKQHLRRGTFLCVIAGTPKDAENTKVQICRSLPNNAPSEIEEIAGFSNFMRSSRAEELLAI